MEILYGNYQLRVLKFEIALDLNLVDGIVTREELRHWMFQEFPNKRMIRIITQIQFLYMNIYQR